MDELQPMRKAADAVGVSRKAVERWVKLGLLRGKQQKVGNLIATMVSVAKVKELAKERRPGRPRKTAD